MEVECAEECRSVARGRDVWKKTVSAAQVAGARQNQRSWPLLPPAGVPKRAKPEPLVRSRKNQHISRLNSLNSVGIRVFGVWFFANRAQRFSQESDSVASDRTRLKKKRAQLGGCPTRALRGCLWFAFRRVRRPAARPTGTTGFVRASAVEAANARCGERAIRARWPATGPRPAWWSSAGTTPPTGTARGRGGRERARPPRAERGGRRRGGERLASDKGAWTGRTTCARRRTSARASASSAGRVRGTTRPARFGRGGRRAIPGRPVARRARAAREDARDLRWPSCATARRTSRIRTSPEARRASRPGWTTRRRTRTCGARTAEEARDEATGGSGATTRDVLAPLGRPADRPERDARGRMRGKTRLLLLGERRAPPRRTPSVSCAASWATTRDCPTTTARTIFIAATVAVTVQGSSTKEASRVPTASPVAPPVATRGAKKFADDGADDDDIHRLHNIDSSWLGDARAATLAPDARSRLGLDAFAALGFVSSSANERDDEIVVVSGADAREASEPRLAPSAGGVRPVGAARLLVPRALK